MEQQNPNDSFGDAFRALAECHGDRLSLTRGQASVEWSLAGDSVRVTPSHGETLDVAFIGRPAIESVGGAAGRPVYRRGDGSYRLDARSSAHLVDDILAFFDGRREPRFVFVEIEAHSLG